MPSNIVNELIRKVEKMNVELTTLKADMEWLKRGVYITVGGIVTQLVLFLMRH